MARTTPRAAPRSHGRDATPKIDPAQSITDEIIALLERGTVPWQQPWRSIGVPRRHEGTPYRGINAFLLGLRAGIAGHGSPFWMTFRQAKEMGAHVRKGERSSLVVYYGTARARGAEAAAGDGGEGVPDGDGEGGGAYRFVKSYRVFNAAQIDGLEPRFHPVPEPEGAARAEPIARWQRLMEAIGTGGSIPTDFGGDRACYVPSLDRIHMPEIARFEGAGQFYSTWWHELTHATKAEGRLDRSFGASRFGNEAYAKEECVAALSQCFADQLMGFGTNHIESHAAYIDSWLRVLRGDKRFLFAAAAHAQRAVDWLVAAAARGGVPLDEWDGYGAAADASGAGSEVQHEAA